MAGFDLDIPVVPEERPVARVLLHYLQGEAKGFGCELRFRWRIPDRTTHYHRYYSTIEGALPAIQVFLRRAFEASPPFVKGYLAGNRIVKDTIIGNVVPGAIAKAMCEFNSGLIGVVDKIQKEYGFDLQLNSYLFEADTIPRIRGPLNALTQSLVLYRSGRIEAEQLAEQAHTTLEILLKTLLQAPNKGRSFSSLVDEAFGIGAVSEIQRDSILKLKDLRRDAKHRGQGIPDKRITSLSRDVMAACHAISSRLRVQNEA